MQGNMKMTWKEFKEIMEKNDIKDDTLIQGYTLEVDTYAMLYSKNTKIYITNISIKTKAMP
jgi:hypothetical protein